MLTPKENYLRVMRHEKPEWLPCNPEDVNFLIWTAMIGRSKVRTPWSFAMRTWLTAV